MKIVVNEAKPEPTCLSQCSVGTLMVLDCSYFSLRPGDIAFKHESAGAVVLGRTGVWVGLDSMFGRVLKPGESFTVTI